MAKSFWSWRGVRTRLSLPKSGRAAAERKPPRQRRLLLEVLESRQLLSVASVSIHPMSVQDGQVGYAS